MRQVYPDAPEPVATMFRTTFFAGAAELLALMSYATSLEDDVTEGDMDFFSAVATEVETAHEKTVTDALMKRARRQTQQ